MDGRRQIAVPDGGQALFPRGYFENMAYTAVLAVENQAANGQVYNAADAEALSLRQIVEMIGDIVGRPWEIIPVPRKLMPSAPQAMGLPYSCDPYDIEPHMLLDLTKVKTELGYHDLVPIRKAMENTVRWLCDNPPQRDWPPIDYPAQDEAIRKCTMPEKD